MTITARLGSLLLALPFAFTLAGCGGVLAGDHDGGGGFQIHIKDLNGKSVAMGMEEDDDAKDLKAKSRSKFKPSKGSETGLDKRYVMQAKRDEAEGAVVWEYETAGDITTWVRVAVDKLDGLVDGTSCAYFEHRPMGGGADAGVTQRLDAMWNSKLGVDGGFTVQAREGAEIVGTPVEIEAKEVFLIIEDTGATANLYAAEATGDGHDDHGKWRMIHSGPVRDPFTIAFGVEGLNKKAKMYFADFTLQSNGNVNIGIAQAYVAAPLYQAYEALTAAQLKFELDPKMPYDILDDLQNASLAIDSALSAFFTYSPGFGEPFPNEDIEDELWDAQWHTNTAIDKGYALLYASNPKPLKKIRGFVDHAHGHVALAIALLSGWKGKNIKKADKIGTVETYGYESL